MEAPPDDDLEVLHTTQQVARTFQVTTQTVRAWIAKGDILPNARRVNGQWRVPHSDVVALANANHG